MTHIVHGGHGVRLMVIDSFQHPGVLLIWETSVLAGEALKMDCFILLFEFSLVSPFYCLTYFLYSFLSVWEVARHDYDTVVWAVNPKIKQIVDLRKSDKLTKNYFHYFIIYIDFYWKKFKKKVSKIIQNQPSVRMTKIQHGRKFGPGMQKFKLLHMNTALEYDSIYGK